MAINIYCPNLHKTLLNNYPKTMLDYCSYVSKKALHNNSNIFNSLPTTPISHKPTLALTLSSGKMGYKTLANVSFLINMLEKNATPHSRR